jgi:hypothetical protein
MTTGITACLLCSAGSLLAPLGIAAGLVGLLVIVRRRSANGSMTGGSEVKSTTGGGPVMKEEDHG